MMPFNRFDGTPFKEAQVCPPLWVSLLALIVLVIGLYHPAIDFPYVWTDHAEIEEGVLVPMNFDELIRALTLPKGKAKTPERQSLAPEKIAAGINYFRPVKVLSYGLDYSLSSGKPWSFHLTNILLHLGVCVLVLFLLRRVCGQRLPYIPEAVAIVHALHPLHVEVVSWISARSDTLWSLFALAAVLFHLRAAKASHPWLLRGFVGLMALLAIGSKESGIVTPLICILFSYAAVADQKSVTLHQVAKHGLAPLLAVSAFCIYRFAVIGDIHPGQLGGRAGLGGFTLLYLFGQNLIQSFIPWRLRLADTVAVQDSLSWLGLVGLMLWSGWLWFGWRWRTEEPLLIIGALGWLVAILPVMQIVPLLQPRGERYLYFPAFFAELTLMILIGRLSRRLEGRRTRWLLATAGLATAGMLALLAHTRLVLWGNERELFNHAVSEEPNCAECWNNLAYAKAIRGDYSGVAQASQRGLAIDLKRWRGYRDGLSLRFLLVRALLLLGRAGEAISPAEEICVRGFTPGNLALLAEVYLEAKRPRAALAAADEGLRLNPSYTVLQKLRAAAQSDTSDVSDRNEDLPLQCVPYELAPPTSGYR